MKAEIVKPSKEERQEENKRRIAKNKKDLIIAYENSLGIATMACKAVGISRETFYKYLNSDQAFKKAIDGILDIQVDYVENSLFKKIKEGDTTAIIFYLKTKGRARGYDERIGIDVARTIEIVKHKELIDI